MSVRVHGLIKRIGRRYRHYVTELGRRAVITGLKLREIFVLHNSAHQRLRELTADGPSGAMADR